ncbi:LPXTG cell wall anchor domain-containing protein [Microbacterium sp. A82]|uniref:LPXTG cell wall anchor domain-containing protein n=1 Tax=Microbacterium sp. A82 TaxID=3450452 RepID=UPI003F4031AF
MTSSRRSAQRFLHRRKLAHPAAVTMGTGIAFALVLASALPAAALDDSQRNADETAIPAPAAAPAAAEKLAGAAETFAVHVNAEIITQAELDIEGLIIQGVDFPAGSEATISIPGVVSETATVDADGWVFATLTARLDAGSYVARISAGGITQETAFEVTAGGYEPWLYLEGEDGIAQWDIKHSGMLTTGDGFPTDATLDVLVDGVAEHQVTSDEAGYTEFTISGEFSVGEYDLTLAAADVEASASRTFVVDDDADWYSGWDQPTISASAFVVTESELAATALVIDGEGFPDYATVELTVDDGAPTAVRADVLGDVEAEVSGPLSVGEHTVTLTHPVGTASVTFSVVPDEQGAFPAPGIYEGTSRQTHASSNEMNDPEVRPFSVEVNDSGAITLVTGEYWWACVTAGYHGSGFDDFSTDPIPTTPVTVGQPFEIDWEGIAMTFKLHGTINADGSASGRIWANLGVCGSSILDWTVQGDAVPQPVDPDPTEPDPTEPDPTEPDPTEPDPTEPDPTEPKPTEPDPTEPKPTEPSTTAPVADYPAPAEDQLTDATLGEITTVTTAQAGQTITVHFAGDRAGQSAGMWLLSTPSPLGVKTVSAEGTVQITLPKNVTGTHRIAAVAADGTVIGWQQITITAAEDEPGLAATGGEVSSALISIAGLTVIAGALLMLRRRTA